LQARSASQEITEEVRIMTMRFEHGEKRGALPPKIHAALDYIDYLREKEEHNFYQLNNKDEAGEMPRDAKLLKITCRELDVRDGALRVLQRYFSSNIEEDETQEIVPPKKKPDDEGDAPVREPVKQ